MRIEFDVGEAFDGFGLTELHERDVQSPSQATGWPTSGPQQQRGTYRPGQGYGAGSQGTER